ncbi:hypothetical protein [Kitasatospora xanthocidica]|uniref:hypothetical protein n=1 Tax=Kitasatospora xanthocidica TaxID=83382 RepID=UPI00167AD986|nr:hypothetical protein [Kitasatospora xanthocidica]
MQALPRGAVRLLPGPFLDAQSTALEHLLSLDPHRLLAPLRCWTPTGTPGRTWR